MLAYFFPLIFSSLVEDRTEDVGLVIGDRAGEIGEIFRPLNDCGDAFKTHAGIDVLRRQRRKGAVRIRVELDEDQVPDLDAPRRRLC